MLEQLKRTVGLIALASAVAFLGAATTQADKKGGGGGGSGSNAAYDVIRLPGPDGFQSHAWAISETNGLGVTFAVGGWNAFGDGLDCLWAISADRNVTVTDLSGTFSQVNGVNSAGMVAGVDNTLGIVRLLDGAVVTLPRLAGSVTRAYGINDPDETGIVQVVGESVAADWLLHGVLWDLTTGGAVRSTTDLGPMSTFLPRRINNDALMAGFAVVDGEHVPATAFFGADGLEVVWLPPVDTTLQAEVTGLDQSGNVCGLLRVPSPPATHGVVWSGSGVIDLSVATGVSSTEAEDLATVGDVLQVVGRGQDDSNTAQYAYLWKDGRLFNLNKLINAGQTVLLHATGVNASGRITGFGTFGSRRERIYYGFLLIPATAP
jgi:hypothetical protein